MRIMHFYTQMDVSVYKHFVNTNFIKIRLDWNFHSSNKLLPDNQYNWLYGRSMQCQGEETSKIFEFLDNDIVTGLQIDCGFTAIFYPEVLIPCLYAEVESAVSFTIFLFVVIGSHYRQPFRMTESLCLLL